ncbi:MAG TPA: LysR family transcriptional regulator [Bryobacteraceae bacterium]
MRAFHLVAHHQSFARAAERLFVTPSGLSVLIRELERQLGFRLFNRTRASKWTLKRLKRRSHESCQIMHNRIYELLHRNLQEVFGQWDAARRRSAIDELYTEDCVLDVPPGTLTGRDALDKFAGDLRATHPHFHYTPLSEPQALHNAGRLAWGSGPRGEAPEYTGLDVIVARDGRTAALYVFLDSRPQ